MARCSAGVVGIEAGDGVDRLPGVPLAALLAAPVDAQGRPGFREGDPAEVRRNGHGLDRAGLPPPVPGPGDGVRHGHVLPWQGLDLGRRGRLVSLEHRDVVGFLLPHQPAHLVLDAVQGVEGDHGAGQIEWFQQRAEGSRLVGLGSHFPLGQGDGGGVGDGGQQVPVALGSVRGAGQRLAVHRDRRPRWRAGAADTGVVFGQVGADRGVQGITVEGGGRRRPVSHWWRGPSCARTAGTGEDGAAGTGPRCDQLA